VLDIFLNGDFITVAWAANTYDKNQLLQITVTNQANSTNLFNLTSIPNSGSFTLPQPVCIFLSLTIVSKKLIFFRFIFTIRLQFGGHQCHQFVINNQFINSSIHQFISSSSIQHQFIINSSSIQHQFIINSCYVITCSFCTHLITIYQCR
jgi:hypothetical protein